MNVPSAEKLELRAFEQRDRLRRTALELIEKVDQTKQALSPSHNARKHFGAAAALVSALGFLLGYGVGLMFTKS